MAFDYALEGVKWGASAINGTPGGTVTWSLWGTFDASYRAEIQGAFQQWASAANIQFVQVTDNTAAKVQLDWGAIDGIGTVLGYTNYHYSGGLLTSADITLDSAEHWSPTSTGLAESGTYFEAVALHEIGHAIGIAHYNAATAIMNAYLPLGTATLLHPDLDAAVALYGPAATSPPAQVIHTTDALNHFAWSTIDVFKGNAGQTTSVDYHMDDGSRVIYSYDVNNAQSYSQAAFVYNANGKETSVDYTMHDGGRQIYTFDADGGSHVYAYDTNNSQAYQQVVFVRDASGRTTTVDYLMDDQSHFIYNYDATGQAHVTHFDASWHLLA